MIKDEEHFDRCAEAVTPIDIPEEALPYLVAQRGAIDDMMGDMGLWCTKYAETLQSDFDCIEPYLPKRCDTLLDIGGGMSGISILLNAYYGAACWVNPVQRCSMSFGDPPLLTRHAETFSNYEVARNFLRINGVENTMAVNPARPIAPNFFDLVISLKSWCFHYEPERYLEFVKGCVIAGKTKIIVMRAQAARRCLSYDYHRTLSRLRYAGAPALRREVRNDVLHRMNSITILAGGFSASRVDLKKLLQLRHRVERSRWIYAPRVDAIVSTRSTVRRASLLCVSKFVKPIYLRLRDAAQSPRGGSFPMCHPVRLRSRSY